MNPSHLVLIHGLANKPPPADLSRIWHEALAKSTDKDGGLDTAAIGVSTSIVYWADLFFSSPLEAGDYESAKDELEDKFGEEADLPDNEWVASLRAKIAGNDEELFEDAPVESIRDEFERIPLPWSLKKRIMRRFLIEAHDYLFNKRDVRNIILQRVQDAIAEAPSDARITILGHSMGTMIGYDLLTHVQPVRTVSGLMTVGSPLGIDEVQDKLDHTRENGFPLALEGEWINVFDPYDVVSRSDPRLSNDFKRDGKKVVIDVKEENWGRWRHSATKYFQGTELRKHLRRLIDRE